MNAENFYEQFKQALKALNLRWGDMDQMEIMIVDGDIVRCTYGRFAYEFAVED